MNNDNKKILIEDAKYGAFIAAIAGLLRLIYMRAFLGALPNALHPSNDARSYWELSLRIYRDGWLLPNDGPFYQAPLYPYALSVLHQFGIHSIANMLWLQAGLGVVNTLLTFVLARSFVSRPAATAAALLFSFSHLVLFLESKLLAATLGTTLLLCFALCAMRWLHTRAAHMLAFAGMFYGLTLLCRPNQIFLRRLGPLYGERGRDPLHGQQPTGARRPRANRRLVKRHRRPTHPKHRTRLTTGGRSAVAVASVQFLGQKNHRLGGGQSRLICNFGSEETAVVFVYRPACGQCFHSF